MANPNRYEVADRKRVRSRQANAARTQAAEMQDELAHYRRHFSTHEISHMLKAIDALNYLAKQFED